MNQKFSLLGVLCVLLFIAACWNACVAYKKTDELESLQKTISEYQLKEKEFQVKVLKDSSKIAEQTQTILSQKQAIEMGLLDMSNRMKSVEAQLKANVGVRIIEKQIPFIPKNFADTSGIVKDDKGNIIRQDSIAVPAAVGINQKDFYFDGTITKKGLIIDSANIPVKMLYTIGTQKQGFFKKAKPIVSFKVDSKYVQIEGLDNVIINEKPKLFWKLAKIIVPSALAFYGGYRLAK